MMHVKDVGRMSAVLFAAMMQTVLERIVKYNWPQPEPHSMCDAKCDVTGRR